MNTPITLQYSKQEKRLLSLVLAVPIKFSKESQLIVQLSD